MSKDQFLDEQFGESPDFAIGLDSGYISAIVKTLEQSYLVCGQNLK